MASTTTFNLDEVKEPTFDVVSGGVTKSYNPWDLAQQLESLQGADATKLASSIDKVREVFGIATLTVTQALALLGALFDFIKEQPELKKLQGLTQS